jgi:phosphoserine phosphatase
MTQATGAVFVRAEGVLFARGVISAAAYFAANAAGFRERALRLSHVALTAPVYGVLGQSDRVLANRLAYLSLRGMSEDRLVELSREYFENVLKEQVLEAGVELLRRARREGKRTVVVADSLSLVIDPLCSHLRVIDEHVCNRLEMRDGVATGRLLEPVVGGHDLGRWVTSYAADHSLALSDSLAYASHGPDLLLLAAVGNPCAVNPDYTLRRAARDAHWPIVDYHV